MLVVAVIAIVFIGPKELPGMLRTFGQVMKKVRALAGEFQGQLNEAIKDSELEDVKKTINEVRSLDPTKQIKDKLNPLKSELEKPIEAEEKPKPKPQTPQEIEAEIKENYAKAQAEIRKSNPNSSGANAVPGFSSTPDPEVKPADDTAGTGSDVAEASVEAAPDTDRKSA